MWTMTLMCTLKLLTLPSRNAHKHDMLKDVQQIENVTVLRHTVSFGDAPESCC